MNRHVRVFLSDDEYMRAVRVAEGRRRTQKRWGAHDKYNYDGYGPDDDLVGTACEFGYARWAGEPEPTFDPNCVVGVMTNAIGGILVRGTRWRSGTLLLHDDSPDDVPFVLARCPDDLQTIELCGWFYGHEGKSGQYVAEPRPGRPCFSVPSARLHPMDDIPGHSAVQEELF